VSDELQPLEEGKEPVLARGGRFQPGQSGNPNGRPKGTRNKHVVLAEELLKAECESILRKLIQLAENGDVTAIKVCLERALPVRRLWAGKVEFNGEITSAQDAVAASSRVITACAAGELSGSEALDLQRLIANHASLISLAAEHNELRELKEQVEALLEERSTK
jgi:hypothetical protein